ncbi:hypothetical protein V8F06_007868 [Rhypophila decipiens]
MLQVEEPDSPLVMSTSETPPTAQHRRIQSILQRLSAALPSTSQAVRRLFGASGEPAVGNSSAAAPSSEEGKPAKVMATPTSPKEKSAVATEHPETHHGETADPDAPVAMLLPGFSRLLTYNPPRTSDTIPDNQEPVSVPPRVATEDLPDTTVPQKEFISPPSKTPNLLLAVVPLEIQSAIFAQPVLTLQDMMNIRRTCRTWRRDIPIFVLDQKLRQQNYAGWPVVFEVNGKKYAGTTYGNRRLCGRCVVPRIRGNLIRGDCVGKYMSSFVDESVRYGRIYRTDLELGEEDGRGEEWWEWPEDRGMCFPCLWRMLEEHVELAEGAVTNIGTRLDSKIEQDGSADSKKIWNIKLAAVEKKEEFTMMDGTIRKICGVSGCLQDIHENAVPCPHCSDFSEWVRRRRW